VVVEGRVAAAGSCQEPTLKLDQLELEAASERPGHVWVHCSAERARSLLAHSQLQGQPEEWVVRQLVKGHELQLGDGRGAQRLRGRPRQRRGGARG
jgi:hypothetical protein